jgi:hypothetical protein
MRWVFASSVLFGAIAPAICQTSSPPAALQLQQIRIIGFEAHERADKYGIASFTISNDTNAPLSSIELNCWMDGDRAHGTRVLVWPSRGVVAPHGSERFSNVNIGLVRSNARSECEVTAIE